MIISQTPLRVSLLGGGTDLPEWFEKGKGCVVGSTIDKYVYVILSKRFDNKIVVGYSKQEVVDSVDEIQHDLVRETAKLTKMTNGFEVKTLSDVPSEGSGLGSSSAILVGLLKAFYEFKNFQYENWMIAENAYDIERGVLKRPVGKQDHFFSAIGGLSRFIFEGESIRQEQVSLSDKNLYLFYTGITRKSSDILSKQTKNINEYTELYYKWLTDLALNYKDESQLPRSIKLNWEYKKDLSEGITTPEIEAMCNLAEKGGAESYKLLGAGGGGFLLVYCRNGKIDQLREIMKDYRELPFRFINFGTRIIFNNEV